MTTRRTQSFTITEELIRAYSRRGNYHSDAERADALGLPGLVAQGVQVAGPAYGLLLDEWGEEFLAHGEIDLRFVGAVYAGDTIEARVDTTPEGATIEIANCADGRVSVVGSAHRR